MSQKYSCQKMAAIFLGLPVMGVFYGMMPFNLHGLDQVEESNCK
jgi:hypothetical protein